MTVAIEDDGLDLVDELALMEHDYVSMEAVVSDLDNLGGRISVEGISRQDAATIMEYDTGILPRQYPLNAFTNVASRTNLKPALEGLFQKAQSIVWKVLESIADLIGRVVDWLVTLSKSKTTPKATEDGFDVWRKTVEARLSEVEKRLSEIDRDKDLTAEDKVKARKVVEEFANKQSDAQTETRRRLMEAYTVVARACMLQPDKMIQLLDYYTAFPALVEHIKLIVKAIEATLTAYEKNPTEAALMAVLGTTNDLTNRFNERLGEICVKINRCRVSDIPFGYYDPEAPDEYLSRVRQALMSASQTPSGKFFRDDFKYGYLEAHKRGVAFSKVSAKIDDFLDKNDTLHEDLVALSKRLRAVIKRVRSMSVGLNTEQIEIRSRLVDISRLLRRSLFAYMRLRELPSVVLVSLSKFTSMEHYSETEIRNAIGQ